MAKIVESVTLPLIALRGNVAFPNSTIDVDLSRPFSVRAFEVSNDSLSPVFLVAQKDIIDDTPKKSDLFTIGTICNIKNINKQQDGTISATFEGVCRAKIIDVSTVDGYISATVEPKVERQGSFDDDRMLGLMQDIGSSIGKLREYIRTISEDFAVGAAKMTNPGEFCDYVASGALYNYIAKQTILEAIMPTVRIEKLAVLLQEELELAETEFNIHRQVKEKVDNQHKEFYLREQMRAIQHELGEDDDEISELQAKIDNAKLPKDIEEKLLKELSRLAKTPFGAAESTVLRNYIDVCLEIPFSKKTNEKINIDNAKEILERDHDGLDKVKERIIEYVAVKHISPNVKNQIICLVGAPGVGKTSIAHSIADALSRKYARVSLGGIRDEADIRGHRKTYVGAMPGRIIEAISNAKVMNPVIVLDEIDKISRDAHGDPSSALLEVLDPEQNKFFRDHFVEFPIDLSDCIFIATANSYDGIPEPLIDRMEIIEIPSYSREEKLNIAVNHLIPKQINAHGVKEYNMKFTDDAVLEIIDTYTREAGVRNLERKIAEVIRKTAKKIVLNESYSQIITSETVDSLLTSKRIECDKIDESDLIGVVNGLAYTTVGGDLLKIETAVMPGTGKLELTGSLGDVMKESAKLAYSYVRSISAKTIIDPQFYSNKDVHIHCPEGAVPKDGPSAGVTMMCSLVSALSGITVKHDIAMTGELSLTGRVLSIGGLREKTMAAFAAGVKTVLIPEGNKKDLDEVDPIVRKNITFITCKSADDVLKNALTDYQKLKSDAYLKEIPITLSTPVTHGALA